MSFQAGDWEMLGLECLMDGAGESSVIYFVGRICLAVTPTCAAQSLRKYSWGEEEDHSHLEGTSWPGNQLNGGSLNLFHIKSFLCSTGVFARHRSSEWVLNKKNEDPQKCDQRLTKFYRKVTKDARIPKWWRGPLTIAEERGQRVSPPPTSSNTNTQIHSLCPK